MVPADAASFEKQQSQAELGIGAAAPREGRELLGGGGEIISLQGGDARGKVGLDRPG